MRSAILIAPILLTGCGSSDAGTIDENIAAQSPVSACVQRGIAYFKEIGAYPALKMPPNAGRAAEVVATERCNRTTTAF